MKIGILGTGNLAVGLGQAWAGAGHTILVTGRSTARATFAAERIGATATPMGPGPWAEQAEALDRTASLIRDLGANTAVLGGLATARQAEEAAGFVMRVVAAGANPRLAVPDVDPEVLRAATAAR
ncbi:NAD(P)-binding domain-containing protein [Embleya sp. MST-111070]|uniref:NAD(P)-binding domain-containing protein n=1 Tax=Embleya sp. MST-111070 TaxID=3398231 RepID=UPI003F73B3AE